MPDNTRQEAEFIKDYELTRDNVLVRIDNQTPYTDSSYIVLQVDSKLNRDFEEFDYYMGAADLLAETNRGGTKADIIEEVISLARKAADMDAIQKMEQLSRKADDPAVKKEIFAIYESLSLRDSRDIQEEIG